MRYEFLFQSRDVGVPYDASLVEKALEARGASATADGSWRWKLESGEVELRRLTEGGAVVGSELRLPLSHRDALAREVVPLAVEVAEVAGVRLVDLSLNRSVRAEDVEAVAESYLRSARYAGEYVGVSEAIGAGEARHLDEQGLQASTKVLIALAVFALSVYLALRLATS